MGLCGLYDQLQSLAKTRRKNARRQRLKNRRGENSV